MVKRFQHIALILTLLLLGGMTNEAWAVEVTYHILTKPFNVKKTDGETNKWPNDIRVEALRCTSSEATIGLPLEFRSPLATNFKYYRGVTCSHPNTKLYDHDGNDNNKVQPLSVTYDIFEETDLTSATLLNLSSPVAAVDGEHIYVTYDYIGNDPAVNKMLLLNGSQNYNIQLTNNRFLCLNRSRNNRPGAANAAALTAEQLASDDFVVPPAGTGAKQIGFAWSTASDAGLPGICLRFKFLGEDPYNVTIMTAYTGSATYTEKLNVEKQYPRYKKPYAGSTLFARMKNDGTTEKGWLSPDAHTHYKSETDETDYDSWQGFYRGDMNPIFNSVAVLPKGTGYMLVASKMNQNGTQYQPNSQGKYAFFSGSNANDPVLQFQTIDKIPVTVTYEINPFTFKVKTPLSAEPLTLTIDWSEDMKTEKILDHIPEALKRKYVTFEGAYKEEGFVNPLTTFEDAEDNGNVIWLKYTSSMPFEVLPAGGSYTDAHWYTIRMNGDHEDRYVVKYATDKFTTGGGSNSDIHQGENSAEAMVAFIGDPFELKIISRAGSESASANRYIGCASAAADATNFSLTTGSSDISTWEIVSDETSGTMVLRQFGTYASPKYIGWHYGEPGNPIYYKTESSRIKVVDLDKKNYVYHIVRKDGSIAVKASEDQYVGNPLRYANIPEIIRSPFVSSTWGSTLSFFSDDACTSAITHAAYDVTESTKHIYVKYTDPTVPSGTYNVRLNGQYIYYDSSEPTIKSADAPENDNKYVWNLNFSDPYAMTVKNQEVDKYVKINGEAGDNVGLLWDNTPTKFIVKSSTITGIYEVMVATGNDVDAADTYYNIGRPAANTVKIYSNASYQHGNAQLRFLLTPTNAVAVTYHLIDKSNKKLLDVTSRREDIFFPADYRSPLVDDDGYHYWATSSMNIAGDAYTVRGGESELASLSDVIDSKFNTPVDHNTDATAYTAADENHKKEANTYENMVTTAKTLVVGTYEFKVGTESYTYYTVEVTSIPDQQIYVTYDTNNSIDLQKGVMYLLKYEAGDKFRQENGSDGLYDEEDLTDPYKTQAIYPYCNGDCNFFVYGQDQFDIQQQGAASTRTRWAWYVESANNDPYHVKICSRQTETYNSDENQAYFRTYVVNYGDANHVVTGLTWPGISGIQGTEYMVLGSTGQYQLVTTETVPIHLNEDEDYADEGENERQVVKSFEQYWKTFDTIRKKIYGHNISNNDIKVTDPSTVPNDVYYNYKTPTAETLRHYLENTLGFHHYSQWAYAKRWNGFNTEGAKSKGWEEIEHWFQTVNMGEGYFDLVEIKIDPVIILLDQHGWEIMRKPIPSNDNYDPNDEKFDDIRPYDSPMVKEYYFWTKTSKRSGFHQYHTLTNQVSVNGVPYVSSSLADLPSYSATNVKDKKGNLLDLYVTYSVKDEYVQSYTYTYTGVYDAKNKVTKITDVVGVGQPFLVQQGDKYAYATNETTITPTVPKDGETTISMSQLIINGNIDSKAKWYLKPNVNIDKEMGYGHWEHSWTNDYDVKEKVKASGFNSNAFDPYNIQISSAAEGLTNKYFVTNATNADLDGEGAMKATYSGSAKVDLSIKPTNENCDQEAENHPIHGIGQDSRTLDMSNATFMAVQDANGNMQLMPRFDHSVRVRNFGTLVTPTAEQSDATKLPETYTKLYRPLVYQYHIIANDGSESLRYKSGGDLVPQMPTHFKSPLAKDFKYYFDHQAAYDTPVVSTEEEWTNHAGDFQKTATDESDMLSKIKALSATGNYYFKLGSGDAISYKKVTVTNIASGFLTDVAAKTDISNREIKESFAGIGLTGNNNDVYIRYTYDEEADGNLILKGKWFTMKLYAKDAKYNEGIKEGTRPVDGDSNPLPINASYKEWQWKLLETPQSDPDPYAVSLYNRSQSAGTKAIEKRFALLSHTSGGYALAEAGLGTYSYSFLNGNSMGESTAATTATEVGFLSTSCSFSGTGSQVLLLDDVEHTFNYKVYTNSGAFAINAEQSHSALTDNDYVPELPEAARTPLLYIDEYRYYNKDDWNRSVTVTASIKERFPDLVLDTSIPDTIGNSLSHLYGLYDDEVYVHYLPYSESKTTYRVPNDIKQVAGHVARGDNSNDAALGLNGNLLYNIVWYDDMMMKSNATTIENTPCGELSTSWALQAAEAYEWKLTGNDPYAIQIVNMAGYSIYSSDNASCTLSNENATTFMLLNQSDYEYGVLAKTGSERYKLSGYGRQIADGEAATPVNPTKFIIFALATHKVIYHLVIAKTATNLENPESGCYETIPYWNETEVINKKIPGSTQRDLASKIDEETSIAGDKYQLGVSLKTIAPSATRDMLYCYDAGHISLGDKLTVPEVFYRPNVVYSYIVEGVYEDDACTSEIEDMNTIYKGRALENMGTETGLLGKTVLINIVYTFDGNLETNSGADFVRDVADNKWYTFETSDDTPWLAQYTNAWGLQVKEGRDSHYTNDFLWTPLGDPYGFMMYNRYVVKNNSDATKVMTSTAIDVDGRNVLLGVPGATITEDAQSRTLTRGNEIYELLADEFTTPGCFKVHPMANNSGTQYYLRVNDGNGYIQLSSSGYTEFTFGLDEKQLKPYFDRAGYVGGLTKEGKAAYEAADGNLMTIQTVVYNDANIVPYKPGYYRLHSQPDIPGVSKRYASGYTHEIEKTANDAASNAGLPMHFYEVEGSGTTFALLRNGNGVLNHGYTSSPATRGDITIPAVESDPASIFYFNGAELTSEQIASGTKPTSGIQTQGLWVKGANISNTAGYAKMTATFVEATTFTLLDIGGAVLLIHNGAEPGERIYLNFDQTDPDHIYDLGFYHEVPTDHAKFCMQPANHLGLKIATHSGGDEGIYGTYYNYASFYAPFDILLPDDYTKDKNNYIYQAFICDSENSPWSPATADLHPKAIGRYSKAGARPETYNTEKYKNKFVPAGTPVLLAMWDQSNSVTVTLPTSEPSTAMTTGLTYSHGDVNDLSCYNLLSGQYLEQKLPLGSTDRIYAFGLPFTGNMELNAATGEVSATLISPDNSGLGFYLNANPNKEEGLSKADWIRNNWYVLGNKVYYHETVGGGGGAPQLNGVQFVPVVFDGEEPGEEELQPDGSMQKVGDGCIYDLLGRKVATKEQVEDGTWRERLAPGIYILNGKKFKK